MQREKYAARGKFLWLIVDSYLNTAIERVRHLLRNGVFCLQD